MTDMPTEPDSTPDSQDVFQVLFHRGPRWLALGFFAVVLISIAHGGAETYLNHQEHVVPRTERFGDPGQSGLSGETWIEPTPVRLGQRAYWRFRLTNHSDRDLRVTLEDLDAPSFDAPEISGVFQVQASGIEGSAWQSWELSLPTKADRVFWIPLRPQRTGAQTLAATLIVQDEPSRQAERLEVTLLKVPTISLWRGWLAHSVKCFVSLLGILAVPLLLAVAGFWFQQRQQKLSHERQAWANMLPKSHENNAEYYVPLLGTIKTLKPLWKKQRAQAPGADLAEITFYILYTLRRLRHIFNAGSGIQLKSRRGENVVTLCINLFLDEARQRLDPWPDVSGLLDDMDLEESISTHLQKVKPWRAARVIHQVRSRVEAWTEDQSSPGFDLLCVTGDVLDFEMNRIYRFWYGTEPDFPPVNPESDEPSLGDRVERIWENRPTDAGVQELKEMWDEYRETGLAEGWFKL